MARSKREIDKDLMYKKLMPSQSKRKDAPDAGESVNEAAVLLQPDSRSQPEKESEPPAHLTPEPHKITVPSMDSRKTEVINVMEEVVLEKLESVLTRFQCCRCDRCKKDIVALSLNKLPPKYMVISPGQPAPNIDAQLNAQIITAMIQAVIKVRAKPRH